MTVDELGLVVRSADPLNCEARVEKMAATSEMRNTDFYIRSHYPAPVIDPLGWRLRVGGLVEQRLALSLTDLRQLESTTRVVTLECAGNGRSFLAPAVSGEQWELGAVSTAEWKGVPLQEVMKLAGVDTGALQVVFRGADRPREPDAPAFERSLSLADVKSAEPLLAYEMNEEPVPIQHGYPLRLIVPGWYAVASVKWLEAIEFIPHSFQGHFQTDRYVYEWDRSGGPVIEPVRHQRVRALVAYPIADQQLRIGPLTVRGVAWSGAASIQRVEISVDGGAWRPAEMLGAPSAHSWQGWRLDLELEIPGAHTLRARATDSAGRTQPQVAGWNRLGYGNNSIHPVTVHVR